MNNIRVFYLLECFSFIFSVTIAVDKLSPPSIQAFNATAEDRKGKVQSKKSVRKRGAFSFGHSSINPWQTFHFPSHSMKSLTHSHWKKEPVTTLIEKLIPVPVHVKVPVDRPIPVTKLVPVTIEKAVPVPVKVSVPQPYPVLKKVPVPIKVPVDRPVPVQVLKPYPVYVEKQVPYPVDKPVPVPVKVPVDRPYPVYVAVEKATTTTTEKPLSLASMLLPLSLKWPSSGDKPSASFPSLPVGKSIVWPDTAKLSPEFARLPPEFSKLSPELSSSSGWKTLANEDLDHDKLVSSLLEISEPAQQDSPAAEITWPENAEIDLNKK